VVLSRLIPKLNNRLTGTGSTIGDLRIKPGVVLRLKGLGEQFSGLYRVTSATHTIDSGGFRTNFEVRKEIWFGSVPSYDRSKLPLNVQGFRLSA
jgi:phage protein D